MKSSINILFQIIKELYIFYNFKFFVLLTFFESFLSVLLIILLKDISLLIIDFKSNLIHDYGFFILNNNELLILFTIIFVSTNLIKISQNIILASITIKYHSFLSTKLYQNLINSEYKKLNTFTATHINNNFTIDSFNCSNYIVIPLLNLINIFISILTITFLLIFMYGLGALIVLIFIIILFYSLILFFRRKTKLLQENLIKRITKFNNFINLIYYGFREVKLQSNDNIFKNYFVNLQNEILSDFRLNIVLSNIPKFIIEIIGIFVFSIIFITSYGDSKIISLISIFGFIAVRYMPLAQQAYKHFASITIYLNSYTSIFESSKFLYNEYPEINPTNDLFEIVEFELKNISYSINNNLIIKNFSYKFSKGGIYWIRGVSGSGKSTLINIIMLFNKADLGIIVVNNTLNIEKHNYRMFQSKISFVSQNYYFIEGSLYDNIFFNNLNSVLNEDDYKRIICVLKVVEFFGTDYEKYNIKYIKNYHISEFGVNLSGGQKQRLAIARALIKKHDILILDESTNALDQASENIILKNIINISLDKILILISHNDELKISQNINIVNLY